MCVCVCAYIYIYIYTERERERHWNVVEKVNNPPFLKTNNDNKKDDPGVYAMNEELKFGSCASSDYFISIHYKLRSTSRGTDDESRDFRKEKKKHSIHFVRLEHNLLKIRLKKKKHV